MDLLLLRPNDQKKVYSVTSDLTAVEPPFWAATIAAYVRKHNISVTILDAEVGNLSPDDVIDRISDIKPRLIGIIVTGNNLSASTWKMHGAGEIAGYIKQKLNTCSIFMWGLHVSSLPEKTLMEEQIDYVIKGENLNSIVQLAGYVLNDKNCDLGNIPGLYYREHVCGDIKGNPQIILEDTLDDMPLPAWDLLPMEKYMAHNWHRFGEAKDKTGYGVIATSLGCPFNCSYCAIHSLFGARKVRFRSVESVVDEISRLVDEYNVYYIKILDENFVLNKRYVEELCDRLIDKNFDLNMWAYARVDTVDKGLLRKMREANIKWLCLGIESADENSMTNVNKGQYNNDKIREVVQMIKDSGINVLANVMYGLPEDNLDSMTRTLDLARELNCEWINMYATMAFPGSELYKYYVENGGDNLPDSWLGYSELSYEAKPLPTKYLSSKEVLKFRDYAFNAFFENNDKWFSMAEEKFGHETVESVRKLLKKKLKRKLLE